MADFALWAAACETAFWPAGTFENAYWENRTAAIENVLDADPVAACVSEMMAERSDWTGARPTFCVPEVARMECGLAENAAGARRPAAPGADFPSHAGYRDRL